MNAKLDFTFSLIVIVALVAGTAPPAASTPMGEAAYVEPILLTTQATTLSVIVTADDAAVAARAVEQVGGQISSDLWLIDAVAATIPADQVEALASHLGCAPLWTIKGSEPPTGLSLRMVT